MVFNKHSRIVGSHAFLSPSAYHWIRYDEDKITNLYLSRLAAEHGTKLHDIAHSLIEEGIKLPKTKNTLNMFVNDAIRFDMNSEQPLYFSDNCFGTADAISFKNGLLRIHDLKTGSTPAHMEQLLVYAALFCLEYDVDPNEIEFELRIYQDNDIYILNPEVDSIVPIMDKIVTFDKVIESLKAEE